MIDVATCTDDTLIGFDKMMTESMIHVEEFSGLAYWVWSDVMKELEKRGKAKILGGSYDDFGKARIQRLYH